MPYAAGYTDSLNAISQRQQQQAYVQNAQQQQALNAFLFAQQQDQARRKRQAQEALGNMLPELTQPPATPPPKPPVQAPPPGQSSMPMVPSQTNPGVMGAMPQPNFNAPSGPPPGMPPPMARAAPPGPQAPAPQAPPPPGAVGPSWKPPAPPQPQGGMGTGEIAPPPMSPQDASATMPRQAMSVNDLAKMLSAKGIKGQAALDMIEEWKPYMDSQNKQELDSMKMQMKLQEDVSKYAMERLKELREQQKNDETKREHEAMDTDRQARRDQAQQRINKAEAGGGAGGFSGKKGELMAAMAERGVSLPAGFRSKAQQVAMLDGLIARNPNMTADQIADKIKTGQIDLNAERAEGRTAGGIAGRVAYAENEIQEIAPLVREASLKVPRDKFVPWNKLKQYTSAQLSDPDLKELHSYLTTMSNAYDMLAARGGTDKDKRAENRRLLDAAESPEALERAISAMENEAKAAGRAAAKSIKSSGREGVSAPSVGTVENGYKFKGGDPAKEANWEKV